MTRAAALLTTLALSASALTAAERPVRLIVRTDDPAPGAALVGATSAMRILPPAPPSPRAAPAGRGRWHLLVLPAEADAEQAMARLRAFGLVESAELDREVRTGALPSDPYVSSAGSWGQPFGDQWGLAVLGLPAAWNTVRGDPSVVVAIVDSGLDFLHPDLKTSLWTNAAEVPGNGVDDDGNGYADDVYGYDFATSQGGRDAEPWDGLGHGTLVAGIASGDTDNGKGIAGASWGCRLMTCKALDDTGVGYVSDVGTAMTYAIDNGAKVINLSLTGGGTSPFLESVVDAARAADVVVVASAGNQGIDVADVLPANIDDVVTVGAVNHWLQVPGWSNHGAAIDVVAPGTGALGPRALGTDFMQAGLNVVGTDYYQADGTSFSAGAVSGVAALLSSAFPGITRDRLVNVLRAGADELGPPGFDGNAGYGRAAVDRSLARERAMTARLDTPRSRALLAFGAALQVTGTAAGADLASWQLFIGSGEIPATFTPLTAVETTPVTAGTLHAAPSTTFADGVYALRLLATSQDGVVYEDRRVIEIDNSRGRVVGSVAWQGDGSPASGVMVWAYDIGTGSPVAPAVMGAGATFQFPEGLPAGSYAMYADGSASEFESEFWQDSLSLAGATPVVVTPMGTASGIDMRLSRRPRLAGTVTDAGGTPLAGHLVEVLYEATQSVAQVAGTAADGRFQFQRLPTGRFYVRARAGDASSRTEYWQEAPVVGQATVVTLADDDDVTGIDFTLAPNTASIAGTVRSALGAPIAGFPLEVLPTAGGYIRFATTDAQGAWQVTRLPAGGFRVRTGSSYDWELQYYDRRQTQAAADVIHVFDGGSAAGVDFVLRRTWFQDVTAASGVLVGAESYDTIGVVPARLDGDARPDLYLVNQVGPNSFLLQDGSGTFRDEAVPRGAGAADLKPQAVVFDLENDGDADIFVPKYGRFGAGSLNLLLRNDGARYQDATFTAGVVDAQVGFDAAVGDYDRDGYLDLYLVNNFAPNVLYRNRGDGTFDDVTASSGAGGAGNNDTQSATFVDVDGDGDQDLFVPCSEFPTAGRGNLLFVNRGNGTFAEEGQARGVMAPPGAYNATFGDVDGDRDVDLFVASSYGGVAYENDGTGRFTDRTAAWGLSGVVASSGCSFGDVDLDGWLDLVIGDFVGGVVLFTGGPTGFQSRSHLTGVVRYGQTKNLALADLDLDGRLDLVMSHDYKDNRIYRSRVPARSWLQVKLRGRRSNRDAIGARVEAAAGGRVQTRTCGSGDAGNEVYPVVHFGLGSSTAADLTIRWPSGYVQTIVGVAANQLLDVTEPVGQALVAAPGPGSALPATVRLFDGRGQALAVAWNAYGGARYGAHVAGGEVAAASPSEEILTMPGPSPVLAPHVRAFGEDGVPVPGISFFAYGALAWGGHVASAGGLSPLADAILTGPGPGGGLTAHVRGFSATGAALPGLSFISHPGLTYGVRPAAVDVDGDGRDEIVAAPGPGGTYWAHLRAFSYGGTTVATVPGGSFWAFTGPMAGARAAGGRGLLVAAPGPGPASPATVRGFSYQAGAFRQLPGFDLAVYPSGTFGAEVALADLDGAGFLEAITAPGPNASYLSHIRAVTYTGSAAQLLGVPSFYAFGSTYGFGASVGSAALTP